MKVRVVSGYGKESANVEEQEKFLNALKDTLEARGLTINSIKSDRTKSDRTTGGPITLDVPEVDLSEVTKAFLSLATDLARQNRCNKVSFDLVMPPFDEPITVLGVGTEGGLTEAVENALSKNW